jgi:hypothetical protein
MHNLLYFLLHALACYIINNFRCQNLGASNRTPVQTRTRLETLWTGVKECRKRVVRETTEGHASFVSRLNSIGLLFVIINL